MEVCPKTFAETQRMQIHFHFIAEWPSRHRLSQWDDWTICGSVPGHVSGVSEQDADKKYQGKRLREPDAAPAHYYAQLPKVGGIDFRTNWQCHRDFQVHHRWVSKFLATGKLRWAAAQEEYRKCVVSYKSNAANLEAVQKAVQEAAIRVRQSDVAKALALQLKPWNHPKERREFLKQFGASVVRARYKFWVLNGTSRTGKTWYARHLLGSQSVSHYVSMSGGVDPYLRGFDCLEHRSIVFDEITPRQVLLKKDLFQAGNELITLGQSPTMTMTYKVHVHAVRMVLCANDWNERLLECEPSEKEWLGTNSIVSQITGKMYVEGDETAQNS